jgi:hypothetical protein
MSNRNYLIEKRDWIALIDFYRGMAINRVKCGSFGQKMALGAGLSYVVLAGTYHFAAIRSSEPIIH